MARRLAKKLRQWLWSVGLPTVEPRILRTLSHDPQAHTQGLAWHQGQLYESTGYDHQSSLRILRPDDGQVLHLIRVPDDWAEGIAIVGSHLFQLGWKSGRARVYRLPDLSPAGTRSFPGQGWGLTARGATLAMTDGTHRVSFLDADFNRVGQVRVTSHGLPIHRLNDLQWLDDKLYINVLWQNFILEVDAHSGRVLRFIDCAQLVTAAATTDADHCLNGIAHCPERNSWYLTGKNWPVLFEVSFPEAATRT